MTKSEHAEFAAKCEHRLELSSFRSKKPLDSKKFVCGSWLNRGNECSVKNCKEKGLK